MSLASDPYLDEHRVAALAAFRAGRRQGWWRLCDDGRFARDRFTATVQTVAEPGPEPLAPAWRVLGEPPRLPGHPLPFYGTASSHTGCVQRLTGYRALSAFTVDARIDDAAAQRWFFEFHSPRGACAQDATVHLLRPCAPHHRVLPVGVERFSLWRKPDGVLTVTARERRHTAADYVFDVDLHTYDGAPVASWQGLRLHVVGPNDHFGGRPLGWSLPVELVGPWLSRRLIECGVPDTVELAVAKIPGAGAGREGGLAVTRLAAVLRGIGPGDVALDESGALRVPGRYASTSHAEGHVLVALAGRPVGVDWRVPADPHAAGRVRAGRSALTKIGIGPRTPLSLDQVSEDGLVVTRGTGVVLVTARVGTALAGEPIVLAIALRTR